MANNNNLKCPLCGFVFPNPIQLVNVSSAEISGNTCNCPRCGHRFEDSPLKGSFDAEGNFVALRRYLSSELTKENLLSLQSLVQQGKDNADVRQNFAQEADKIAPGLGEKINTILGGHTNTMAFLQTLATIIATILTGLGVYAALSPAPAAVINNTTNNYYGSATKPKIEQAYKPKPGKLGSNLTPPKKARKKRGKRT
jgi:hypothetical protein